MSIAMAQQHTCLVGMAWTSQLEMSLLRVWWGVEVLYTTMEVFSGTVCLKLIQKK